MHATGLIHAHTHTNTHTHKHTHAVASTRAPTQHNTQHTTHPSLTHYVHTYIPTPTCPLPALPPAFLPPVDPASLVSSLPRPVLLSPPLSLLPDRPPCVSLLPNAPCLTDGGATGYPQTPVTPEDDRGTSTPARMSAGTTNHRASASAIRGSSVGASPALRSPGPQGRSIAGGGGGGGDSASKRDRLDRRCPHPIP